MCVQWEFLCRLPVGLLTSSPSPCAIMFLCSHHAILWKYPVAVPPSANVLAVVAAAYGVATDDADAKATPVKARCTRSPLAMRPVGVRTAARVPLRGASAASGVGTGAAFSEPAPIVAEDSDDAVFSIANPMLAPTPNSA